jgi:AcrR family transcriptional regulator
MHENARTPVVLAAFGGPGPGENGVGREQVSEIQRARILAAMVAETSRRGVGNVTVAHVVARSGLSRRTFYEIFDDREACFLAAFDAGVERIAGEVLPAYEHPGRWCERVRAGLIALLLALENDPDLARLLIVESLGAGSLALERRSRVFKKLTGVVEEGRGEARNGSEPAPLTAEGLVGAVLSILHGRLIERSPGQPFQRSPGQLVEPNPGQLVEGSPGRLVELTGPLMGMIVLPYLGPAAARREQKRALPAASSGEARGNGWDPLREVGMRLTYRTVRVLMAVAAAPGSSNRAVADGAGISDQGQISKLLTRLQRFGLIENSGVGAAHGEPNAWTLTQQGRELQNVIDRRTPHTAGVQAGRR